MKNILASIFATLFAIGIGFLFMKHTSNENVRPVINPNGDLKAFQVGAFANEVKALELASSINGKVVLDDGLYYVYLSVLSDSKNIEKMISYLNNNNTYYYIKSVNASSEFMDELYKYEELMKVTTSDIAFMELNKKLINIYEVE